MIKKIMILVFVLLNTAYASFSEIDEKQLVQMQKDGVVIIDIRREEEFVQLGIIEGSHTLTFFDEKNNYNVPAWMNEFVKIVKNKDQPFIIYCAHANRTKVVGNFLNKKLKYKNIYDLKGGIDYGWLDKGKKTVRYTK